ncbi:homoserine kinase, partial [Paenibacillus sepulcri]|nr:homoserine kinase [Paenibacillus sepulcri]
MTDRKIIVKVPASTANLGPGFDTLGMALSLYSWLEMSLPRSGKTVIELHGEGLDGIPLDKSNLIYKVAQLVFAEADIEIP